MKELYFSINNRMKLDMVYSPVREATTPMRSAFTVIALSIGHTPSEIMRKLQCHHRAYKKYKLGMPENKIYNNLISKHSVNQIVVD